MTRVPSLILSPRVWAATLSLVALAACTEPTPNDPGNGVGLDAADDGGATGADGGADAVSADAGQTDAGQTDAGQTDAGQTDAGQADAGSGDAGQADAGTSDGAATDGLAGDGLAGDGLAGDGGDTEDGADGESDDVGALSDIGAPDAGTPDGGPDATDPDATGPDATGTDATGTDATSTDTTGTDTSASDAASPDAGNTDAGSTDAGSTDAASTDAAGADAGTPDAMASDAGAADTTTPDTGAADTTTADTGAADTGATDTGATDTGATDTGATDTGATDTGTTDTGATDTGATDTGATDTGATDTGATDTGATDTGATDAGPTDTSSSDTDAGGPPKCVAAKDCDDGNACTIDACDQGVCGSKPREDGAQCALGTCQAGVCTKPPALPKGALVITEIHFDPAKVNDSAGEWFEVYNPGAKPVELQGLQLLDKSSKHVVAKSAAVPPKGFAVLGINADAKTNGGVALSYAYTGLALSNSSKGGRIAVANADGSVIDEVVYETTQAKLGWPGGVAGRSYELSPEAVDASKNNAGKAWCWGRATFGAGDRGTPGKAGTSCRVSWCRLQWPTNKTLTVGAKDTWYLRLYHKGVTDKTDATDPDPDLVSWVGLGADKSDPAGAWVWSLAVPNTKFSAKAANEPNNDETQAVLTPKATGAYDTAGRVSWRGSQDFVYCDTAAGAGKDGAEDGYKPENAGVLTVVGQPSE